MMEKRIKEALGLSHVEIHEKVSSTQDRARTLSAEPPYLVWARLQSKGRGRLGRAWQSDEGGLYFTLVIKPPSQPWAVPLVSAYTLWKVLSSKVLDLRLKWPNDLFVGKEKIAGVMVEGWHDRMAIGVGLNVNQRSFPDQLPVNAVSLRMLAGYEFNLESLLISIVRDMLKAMDELGEHGFNFFHSDVRRVLISSDQPVKFMRGNESFTGRLLDLGSSGDALVQTSEGKLFSIPAQHLLEVT